MIFYPHSLQISGGYSKLQSPMVSPISEPPSRKGSKKSLGNIEIKVDSTTTTTNISRVNENHNTYTNGGYNKNNYSSSHYNIYDEGWYNVQNNHVQLPPRLATNNRQVISYSGTSKQMSYM